MIPAPPGEITRDHAASSGSPPDEPAEAEPERLDREAVHGIQTDVAEEQRARPVAKPRAEPEHEGQEDPEVPERLVEEGGMKVVVLREPGRSMRRRDVELPRQV